MTVQRCLKCKDFTSKSASFSHFHSLRIDSQQAIGNLKHHTFIVASCISGVLKQSRVGWGFYFSSSKLIPVNHSECTLRRQGLWGRDDHKKPSVFLCVVNVHFYDYLLHFFYSRNMVYHHITLYQSHNTSLSSAFTISAKMWHGLLAQTRHPCRNFKLCGNAQRRSFHHFIISLFEAPTEILGLAIRAEAVGASYLPNLTASELAERGRGGAVETQKGLKILLRLSKA